MTENDDNNHLPPRNKPIKSDLLAELFISSVTFDEKQHRFQSSHISQGFPP